MTIQRKHDFQAGTRISSNQVDEEFNQLVAQINLLLEEAKQYVPYNGAVRHLNLGGNSLEDFWRLKFEDKFKDGIYYRMFESDVDGEFKIVAYNSDGTVRKIMVSVTPDGILSTIAQSQVSVQRTLTIGMTTSGVDYKVFFDEESRDTQNEFASSIFIPKKSGMYLFTVGATFSTLADGNTYVKLYENGGAYDNIGGASNQQILSLSDAIYLTEGRKYDFYIVQNSGSSKTVTDFRATITKLT